MKRVILSLVIIFTCTLSIGGEEAVKEPRCLDLSRFSLSGDIPTSWMLAHTPYNSLNIIPERLDIVKSIVEREQNYTWRWVTKVISYHFMIRMRWELKKEDIFLVSGLGQKIDDAAVLSWKIDGYEFELIDSRLLTLLIRKDGLTDTDLLDIFKNVIKYPFKSRSPNLINIFVKESHQLCNGKSYGKIVVDHHSHNISWFIDPIEWYRDGDFVLFIFQKVLTAIQDKGGWFLDYKNLVGGIPPDDPRSFLRFENSNREQMAEEYGKKIFAPLKNKEIEKRDPNKPAVVYGRAIHIDD